MGKLIGDADQICGYGFSSTYLGNKALHTDKMNMLKASILTEQVTYSLDCDGMKDSDIKELKRKSKIELLVKIFGLNGASGLSSDAIDSNKQIDLIAKVVETLKSKS
ncbi:hypothetical protein G3488_22155 [Shewanella baltica]|nr:hypothetical protein [Shewanella baltica]